MSVKLLTDHHLRFLSLKGGYTGSSESTLVKMAHCWKSHVMAQMIVNSFLQRCFVKDCVFLNCFVLANSADTDEILHVAAFHLDLHCLLKYLFTGFQYTKS